jgi:redox-sensitive bicupin YhaK (pirin superfamily)
MIEVTTSHVADVAGLPVRRALPRRDRRTIGAWCFVDHMGPVDLAPPRAALDVAPHPHLGLQTVTWLFDGEAVHRDSLGTEQPIRPGQLNLMTAGRGVVHSEESMRSGSGAAGALHGVQLWVAQPDATRHGPAAFEHHAELPAVELTAGTATVLVGDFGGVRSTARRDTDHVGVELLLRPGTATVELDPRFEHGVVVFEGAAELADVAAGARRVEPGHLAYLGLDRSELTLRAGDDGARLLLFGGVPFEAPVKMWWNFVARTHDELDEANRDWRSGSERFGDPGSTLARVPSPDVPWRRA